MQVEHEYRVRELADTSARLADAAAEKERELAVALAQLQAQQADLLSAGRQRAGSLSAKDRATAEAAEEKALRAQRVAADAEISMLKQQAVDIRARERETQLVSPRLFGK